MKQEMFVPIDGMRQLESLGIDTSTASFCWVCENNDIYLDFADEYEFGDNITPAFIAEDLLHILPEAIPNPNYPNDYLDLMVGRDWCSYRDNEGGIGEDYIHFECESLTYALFRMIKWCTKNNINLNL